MSKKKLTAIIVACVITVIAVVVITTHLITAPAEDSGERERVALSAYDFAREFFDPELTSLQREDLWKDYKGKQVEWTNELNDVALGAEGLVAYFLNPGVKAVFDESQRPSLLELREGDLVVYTGVLVSFGEAEINLTDCTIVSLAIVPLWWNNQIDTRGKRMLVGDTVLCFGPDKYGDTTGYDPPGIAAIHRETGNLLWEDNETRSVLMGIDSGRVYTWHLEHLVIIGVGEYATVVHEIAALYKLSGRTAWTALLSQEFHCPEKVLDPKVPLSACLDTWVLGRTTRAEIIGKAESGLTFLADRPPLSELTYYDEAVTFKCAHTFSSGTQCAALRAIDLVTGAVLWEMTFQSIWINDFAVADGTLYVSTDKGVGAFGL